MDEIDNSEIELSATVVFYDKNRPAQLAHFLQTKFKLKGPFQFLGNYSGDQPQTKSSQLKAISEQLKNTKFSGKSSKELISDEQPEERKTIFGIVLAVTEECLQVLLPVGLESLTWSGADKDPNVSNVGSI